eukprot:CAMPEP_0171155268 /NCGR_PEP_ID=MMETSP0790-20130122/802_1 /TAXON_ID=2925 /ORGANISM="Alexandrium catenella, Strain OF101" /LENGTH=72 /DNA_ID=CAMNT_0011619461 /DNA_START=196 /DNA_END=410 /DNA_ORIENTATION=+
MTVQILENCLFCHRSSPAGAALSTTGSSGPLGFLYKVNTSMPSKKASEAAPTTESRFAASCSRSREARPRAA